MKMIDLAGVAGIVFAIASTTAVAGDNIVTRSAEDANADLMRTYKSHGGRPAGNVTSRNAEAANADLVRNYGAKVSDEPGRALQSRSVEASYDDLMRLYGAAPPADK